MFKKIYILLMLLLTWTMMILGVISLVQSSQPIKTLYLYVFMILYVIQFATTYIGLAYIFKKDLPIGTKKRYKD